MSRHLKFTTLALAASFVCAFANLPQAHAQMNDADQSPLQGLPAPIDENVGIDCVASVPCVCPPKFATFGEFMALRPRDSEVAYAVPIDGPITPTLGNATQIGPTAIVDFDYQYAYRVGGEFFLDNCRSIRGTYTNLDSDTSHQVTIAPPDVIRSLVTHPLGTNAAFDGLNAAAQFNLDYDTIDVEFVWMQHECSYSYGLTVGARYGRIEQQFRSQFETNGGTFVNTNVEFEGAGLRLGALGDFYACNRNLLLYFRSNLSLMAGEASADYLQGDVVDPVEVQTSWEAGRLVSVADLELGVGWQSCDRRIRVSAGYVISAWMNMVQTDEFITAVQQNQFNQGFDNLGDFMSFDGVTGRLEVRF